MSNKLKVTTIELTLYTSVPSGRAHLRGDGASISVKLPEHVINQMLAHVYDHAEDMMKEVVTVSTSIERPVTIPDMRKDSKFSKDINTDFEPTEYEEREDAIPKDDSDDMPF